MHPFRLFRSSTPKSNGDIDLKWKSKMLTGDKSQPPHAPGSYLKMSMARSNLRYGTKGGGRHDDGHVFKKANIKCGSLLKEERCFCELFNRRACVRTGR
jgi:hypothetical protein